MKIRYFAALSLFFLPLTAWAPLKDFHTHIGLCKETREELKPKLLQKEIDTVKSEFFCKGNTFPVPEEAWDCKPAAKPSAFCKKTYWNCDRRYVCVPEQKGQTRQMALRELEEKRARLKPVAKTETDRPKKGLMPKKSKTMDHVGTCRKLSAELVRCEPFECRHPHPMMQSFTVEETITGMEGGRCVYSQTMPNGGRMDCRFKKESLPRFAALFDELFNEGNLELKKAEPGDYLSTGECQIAGYGK